MASITLQIEKKVKQINVEKNSGVFAYANIQDMDS